MREALLKKRFGVPALLLIVILLTAGSIAAFAVDALQFTTNPGEPLAFNRTDGLNIPRQGESDDITVNVSNAGNITYGIFVDATVEGPVDSVSYSETKLIDSEPARKKDFNSDGDIIDAKYNIDPKNSLNIAVTIDTADDAAPGEVKVTLDFHREYAY